METLNLPSLPVARFTVTPLGPQHDRAAFSCGVEDLDRYLRQQASQDDKRSLSRIFVLTTSANPAEVLGYYTLSSYSISLAALPPALGKRLPGFMPLPATLLGRLATHTSQQGQGLGTQLLLHAMRMVLRATHLVASIGIVVDAMNEGLVAFYERNGFVQLMDKPLHLIAPMSRIRAIFPEEAAALPDVEEIFQRIQAKEKLEELLSQRPST